MQPKNKKTAGSYQTAIEKKQDDFIKSVSQYKKYPPYGKKIYERLLTGERPSNDVFFFIGIEAWHKTKAFSLNQWVTMLPLGTAPNEFRWDFINSLSVLIFDTGDTEYQLIRYLAFELLLAGASIVRMILFNSQMIIFRQGGNHAQPS